MAPRSAKQQQSQDAFDRTCGWTGRVFLLLLSGGGLALSFLAGFSCDFFSFENSGSIGIDGNPWIGLVPPFDASRAADIGLFSYRITDSIIPTEEQDGCIRYDDIFFEITNNNKEQGTTNNGMGNLWVTAQICAVAAVSAGGLAFIYILLETVSPCLSYPWLIPALLLFIAFGCQCCTFLIFLETTFCFKNESSHDCRLERGGYYSIGSVVGYWLAWLITCNLPRNDDGCFLKKRRSLEDDRFEEERVNDEEQPAVQVVDTPVEEEEVATAAAETQTVTVELKESDLKEAAKEKNDETMQQPPPPPEQSADTESAEEKTTEGEVKKLPADSE